MSTQNEAAVAPAAGAEDNLNAAEQHNPVNIIVDRALEGSSMAQKFGPAIKTSLERNGFATLGLMGSMNAEGCKLITDEVTADSKNLVRDTALVLSSLTSMIREAKQELEFLYQTELNEEKVRTRKAIVNLPKVIREAQDSSYTLSIGPNLIGSVACVKKVIDQPLAYVELNEFLLASHAYDADLETITTVTGEVVQRRKSDGKKRPIHNVGEWNQCFLRYMIALQLSATGRKSIDLGSLLSYMSQVSLLFTCHPMSVVFDAEASYRRSGAMAVAAGTVSMSQLFGSEAYVRPRLDMEINIAYNQRQQKNRPWQSQTAKGLGKGKGGKGKGVGLTSAKGKGKGKGKSPLHRSEPYRTNDRLDSGTKTVGPSNISQ
ncbi:hypothetical protein Pmar_PMAR006146 [Perkinsus marinus ATCC 50983]|uniref:Uncharacterized protein n=1 Tax=Perkinsus marinus (strain ATCC 50983 / TXsc) TaxID=423536 RepID=C5LAC2_PERM5|nr:hypothetical protein Pmar_PMAR006146 [Perkinsus marinus ATCC 50983]EER06378.1 hypothetical protein Pmar_PMAR006146 [Perkinsus marinus ATCC 50983]|eukprot:XP_002774562.1 hypothetical protein Pmar_PMAR006146 [Perkinsus marinus ATCC 50983]